MNNSIAVTESPDSGQATPSPHAAVSLGALLGFLGVALGAFGAHGLQGMLDGAALEAAERAKRIDWWKTAAHYQLVHAVAIVAIGALPWRSRRAPVLMVAGVLIFSGTLYAMALGAPRWFGAITPIGGVLLMAGWLGLLLGAPFRGQGKGQGLGGGA